MSVIFKTTNLTATVCIFIDDLGKVQWFSKGQGYMCICQNKCDVPPSSSADDGACENTYYWGEQLCQAGLGRTCAK
jgi:hypothetical protein